MLHERPVNICVYNSLAWKKRPRNLRDPLGELLIYKVGFMSENQTPELKPPRLHIFIKVKTNFTSAISLVTMLEEKTAARTRPPKTVSQGSKNAVSQGS